MNKDILIAKELFKYDAVVLTGGSSGIGKAFLELISVFSDVKICNISRNRPDDFTDSERFLHVPCNLQNFSEILEALPKVFDFVGIANCEDSRNFPKILLINNSGFGCYGEFPEPSIERNCDMIDLNVRALTYLCGRFMEYIKRGQGSIINIASTAAWQPCPQLAVYAASKSYVMSFTLALSNELKSSGAKCLCICPGPTSSNFFRAAGFDTPPLSTGFGHKADEVAKASLVALAKGKSLKVVGFVNTLQTILVRFLPISLMLAISGAILRKIRKAPK